MKAYIAGPMTGRTHYNLAAFRFAAAAWRLAGHDVWTPFDSNTLVWRRTYGRDFVPTEDRCEYGDPVLCELMAENLAALMRAEAIVLLEGWERSKGTMLELHAANLAGKRVFLHTMEPVSVLTQVIVA